MAERACGGIGLPVSETIKARLSIGVFDMIAARSGWIKSIEACRSSAEPPRSCLYCGQSGTIIAVVNALARAGLELCDENGRVIPRLRGSLVSSPLAAEQRKSPGQPEAALRLVRGLAGN